GLRSLDGGTSTIIRPAGVAFVALELDALAQASFEGLGPDFLHCILDVTDPIPQLLTDNGACHDATQQTVPAVAPRARWQDEFPMAGRKLALYFEASGTDPTAAA